MKGRFAITEDGNITVCTASPENIGKGRCKHLDHQMQNETPESFVERMNEKYRDLKQKMTARNDGTNLVYSYNDMEHKFGKETIVDLNVDVMMKLLKSDDPDEVQWTQGAMKSFSEYAESVYYHESENNMAKKQHSGDSEMIKSELLRIDRSRKYKHNAAIADMHMLNNLAQSLGYEKVFDGEVDTNNPILRREIRRSIIKYWNTQIRSDIMDLNYDDL